MDIDIDFPTSFNPNSVLKNAIPASMVKNGKLVKHPCGHYLQSIPVDPITGLAAIPYEEAEALGYFKVDFLHLSLLDQFKSKSEMREMMAGEPDWSLLLVPEHVEKLFQLRRNASLLEVVAPSSVEEIADCIALIRPGKRNWLNAYIKDREKTRPHLYRAEGDDTSAFRKSHAIAYALTIVLQLHLIKQGKL